MCDASLKPIIEKLEALFQLFNEHFYEGKLLPPVITVSPDTTSGAFGWCSANKIWTDREQVESDFSKMTDEEFKEFLDSEGFYEINLCAEHISRSFEDTSETLLHEMVHLYNLQTGVQDCSRGWNYHNKHFAKAAQEHGLEVFKDSKNGWAITALTEETKEYLKTLDTPQFELHRKKIPKRKGKKKSSSRKYVCHGCGCSVRATKEVHIMCADCGMDMEEEE